MSQIFGNKCTVLFYIFIKKVNAALIWRMSCTLMLFQRGDEKNNVIESVGYLGTWLVEVDCPLSELADQLPDEECTGSSLSHFLLASPTFPLSLSLTDADVDDSTFFNCFNLILPQSFNKSRLDFFSVSTTVVLLDTMSSESLLLSDKELKTKRGTLITYAFGKSIVHMDSGRSTQ